MSTTPFVRIRRDIQVQHDNFEGAEDFETIYDYDLGWLVDEQQATDLVSNWEYQRNDRDSETVRKVYALATAGPDYRPIVSMWAPVVKIDGENYYSLDRFPFPAHIEIIGKRPEKVKPDPTPDDAAFLAFGKAAAAILVSNTEWSSDTTHQLGIVAHNHLGQVDCDMPLSTYLMWKPLVENEGDEMWEYAGDE